MKLSELKELIKNSMLEVSPKSGATTLQEKDKVKLNLGLGAGNKYQYPNPTGYGDIMPTDAMTPEELRYYEKMMGIGDAGEMTPGEEPMEEGSVFLNYDEVYKEYAPLVMQYMENGSTKNAAISKAEDVLAKEYRTTSMNIQSAISHYFDNQYNKATYGDEEPLDENTFKKGDRVTYLGHPGEITGINKEMTGAITYNVEYNRGNGKTKVTNLSNKGGEIKLAKVKEAAIPEVVKRADRIVESWNYKKKSLLTEGADLSTQVTSWKQLGKDGREILVTTADGEKEKFTLSDIDESELSYGYNFDDTRAYLTYHNAEKSKTLGMTSHITGSPDSPKGYDELELDYLTDNTGKLSEGMHGGYIELMEMNPKFDEGLEMVLEVWNEWKSGQMTEPEMIDEAREDLLSYLSSVLR